MEKMAGKMVSTLLAGVMKVIRKLSCMCVCAKSLQSCLPFCDPTDHTLPGYTVHGILQVRISELVPFSPPGEFPHPDIEPKSPALAGRFFTTGATWEAQRNCKSRLGKVT